MAAALLAREWRHVEIAPAAAGGGAGGAGAPAAAAADSDDPGPVAAPYRYTVLQWNMLADGLAQTGGLVTPPGLLTWEARWPLIQAEIAAAAADIVCMQEVNHVGELTKLMRGYDVMYCPKLRSPALHSGADADGIALFTSSARFRLVDARTVHYRRDGGVLANQAVLLAHLSDRSAAGRHLVVGCTHLKAGGDAASVAMRADQARQLVRAASQFRTRAAAAAGLAPADMSLLLAGDLNDSPDSAMYTTMMRSNLHLASAYNSLPRPPRFSAAATAAYAAGEPDFTTWKWRTSTVGGPATEHRHTSDYIWVSPTVTVEEVRCLPTAAAIGVAALPSRHYPSDHLSLAVRVSIA